LQDGEALKAFLALALSLMMTCAAMAQEHRGARPGEFDFWVLSLSWSPAYCRAKGDQADRRQCARGRDLGFVVHGLWPQYERGFPSYCRPEPLPLSAETIRSVLDVIPSAGLARHQWRKHGTCSGLGPAAYFAAVRQAAGQIHLPRGFEDGDGLPQRVTTQGLAEGFITANRGLRHDMLALVCEGPRLTEVRLCLSKTMQFRSCPDVARRSCRRPLLEVADAPE
jgi:ribonuclease T2